MKRFALLLAILAGTIQAFGSANASGKLTNPDTSGAVPGYAQFTLYNCGGNFPQVAGSAILSTQQFTLNADGTWSGILDRNDEITCNGTASTWWRLQYFVSGRQIGPSRDFVCSQASCVFDGAGGLTPITTYPAPPAPAQPLTGAESVVCSFPTPASTWSCTENMGTQQVVAEFFDLNSKQILPDTAQATDVNTFVGTFLQPQAGFMRVVNVGNWTPSVSFPNYIIGNPTSDQSIAGDHALTLGGSLSAKRIEHVRIADANTAGADICAKIATMITELQSTGGIVDATYFEGAQSCASDPLTGVSSSEPVDILLGYVAITTTAQWTENGNKAYIGKGGRNGATSVTYSGTGIGLLETGNANYLIGLKFIDSAVATDVLKCSDCTRGYHDDLFFAGSSAARCIYLTSSSTGTAWNYFHNFEANACTVALQQDKSGSGFTNNNDYEHGILRTSVASGGTVAHITNSNDNTFDKIDASNYGTGTVTSWLEDGNSHGNSWRGGLIDTPSGTLTGFSFATTTANHTIIGVDNQATVAISTLVTPLTDMTGEMYCGTQMHCTFGEIRLPTPAFGTAGFAVNFYDTGNNGNQYLYGKSGAIRISLDKITDKFIFGLPNGVMNAAGGFASTAASPATTGFYRLASGETVSWRNNGNSADIPLGHDASDRLTYNSQIVSDGSHANTITVASGSVAMPTSAVASGACVAASAQTATGVATSDSVSWAYNSTPAANPGQLVVAWSVQSGTVTPEYCNPSAGSITPSAATLNWRVVR